jgi:hypothetical protein
MNAFYLSLIIGFISGLTRKTMIPGFSSENKMKTIRQENNIFKTLRGKKKFRISYRN